MKSHTILNCGIAVENTMVSTISVKYIDHYMLGSTEDFNRLMDVNIECVAMLYGFNTNEHFDWVFPGVVLHDLSSRGNFFLDSWYLKYPIQELPEERLLRAEYKWKMRHMPAYVCHFSSEDDYLRALISQSCAEFDRYSDAMREWSISGAPHSQEDCIKEGTLNIFQFVLPFHRERREEKRLLFRSALRGNAPQHLLQRLESILDREHFICTTIEESIRVLSE